ncbi:copper chaperone PCu(A)C [Sphingomonas flavalba]|uniref:copper chaperone PCu(A)C n=1 Tax=Sphingomonas flavalba TaxID=2559804 RepID=UPI0039E132D2
MTRCFIAAALLAATAAAPGLAASQSAIAVDRAWARQTAPGQSAGGAFMTITNHGKAADRLIGGSAAVASRVEVHTMAVDGGVMRMRPVTGGLSIPAGASVALRPGGYHIMLIGLKAPLARGSAVPVTLRFEKAGAITVRLQVEAIGATAAGGGHDQH